MNFEILQLVQTLKYLKNTRPTWCHLLFYFTSYVLGMFRTLIYPSLGACDCAVELPHPSFCSWFVVYWRFGVVIQQNSRKLLMMDILIFWCRNYFLILAHPVYKMWIMQEPNNLELWNKLHFEEQKRRVYTMFKIFGNYICWINI